MYPGDQTLLPALLLIFSSNNPEEENEPIEEEDTKNKKIILKPREIHLKEQMSKMNFDNTVLSGINKGIEVQLKSIKDEMLSKNVAFSNNQKIINKSFDFSLMVFQAYFHCYLGIQIPIVNVKLDIF